ncbi:MAG: hemin uptake protein HemP [Alphaproteobacteria bacterium]
MHLHIPAPHPRRAAKNRVGELTKEGGPGRPGDYGSASKPAEQGRTVRRTTTEDLLQGGNELIIAHRGEEYRLRITSNGKLILNK